jgi:hypothetical protein
MNKKDYLSTDCIAVPTDLTGPIVAPPPPVGVPVVGVEGGWEEVVPVVPPPIGGDLHVQGYITANMEHPYYISIDEPVVGEGDNPQALKINIKTKIIGTPKIQINFKGWGAKIPYHELPEATAGGRKAMAGRLTGNLNVSNSVAHTITIKDGTVQYRGPK